MSEELNLYHTIPQVGPTTLRLYPPAEKLYSRLRGNGEIRRLNKLRHLGAYSSATPGARQARWDYTAAILYYAQNLRIPGTSSSFKIGPVQFSSSHAALQCMALVWNVGHLPGTFAVEKGVYRFLHSKDCDRPADLLEWPFLSGRVRRMRDEANRFLHEQDYLGMARVLGSVKLLSFATDSEDWLFDFAVHFACSFLLGYEDSNSSQWAKLRKAFEMTRHLAYLTLDSPTCGLQWAPSIPALLNDQLGRSDCDLDRLANSVGEILSPFEKQTFEIVYHSSKAREEAAILSERVFQHLASQRDPYQTIREWLSAGLLRELRLGRQPHRTKLRIAASVKLRSLFATSPLSPVEIERSLRKHTSDLPLAWEYRAWNSDVMFEPDELIIDVLTQNSVSAKDVGRLLVWFIGEFDNLEARPDDSFELLRKADLESTYRLLLQRAVQIAYPELKLEIRAWDLRRFGIFDERLPESRGAIWASNARLNDPVTKRILRSREKRIPDYDQDAYAELLGIRQLRFHLRSKWKPKRPRQRFLVVTGSAKFCSNDRDLIEFDGGLLRISSRSGAATWYGLETKRGSGDPCRCLERKLRVLGIDAAVFRLSTAHAFVELHL